MPVSAFFESSKQLLFLDLVNHSQLCVCLFYEIILFSPTGVKMVGKVITARSAAHIQAACMVRVLTGSGNATAIPAGEDHTVIKVNLCRCVASKFGR